MDIISNCILNKLVNLYIEDVNLVLVVRQNNIRFKVILRFFTMLQCFLKLQIRCRRSNLVTMVRKKLKDRTLKEEGEDQTEKLVVKSKRIRNTERISKSRSSTNRKQLESDYFPTKGTHKRPLSSEQQTFASKVKSLKQSHTDDKSDFEEEEPKEITSKSKNKGKQLVNTNRRKGGKNTKKDGIETDEQVESKVSTARKKGRGKRNLQETEQDNLNVNMKADVKVEVEPTDVKKSRKRKSEATRKGNPSVKKSRKKDCEGCLKNKVFDNKTDNGANSGSLEQSTLAVKEKNKSHPGVKEESDSEDDFEDVEEVGQDTVKAHNIRLSNDNVKSLYEKHDIAPDDRIDGQKYACSKSEASLTLLKSEDNETSAKTFTLPKTVDHNDAMSVLLHMEGIVPGTSGQSGSKRESLSESESDVSESDDEWEEVKGKC